MPCPPQTQQNRPDRYPVQVDEKRPSSFPEPDLGEVYSRFVNLGREARQEGFIVWRCGLTLVSCKTAQLSSPSRTGRTVPFLRSSILLLLNFRPVTVVCESNGDAMAMLTFPTLA